MEPSQLNNYFKRIAASHSMSRADVVRCCALGGIEITTSRADGWKRSEADERRFVRMTEPEFDAFTAGLVAWAAENYN